MTTIIRGIDEYSYSTKILLSYKLTFGVKIITKYKVSYPNTTQRNSYFLTIDVLCINRRHSSFWFIGPFVIR